MSERATTPAERMAAALGHREPDRVPLVLPLTLHGARALGMSIREYYAKPGNVIEGQLRMRERYGHDALVGAFYASVEMEAWGSESIYRDDGPPNAGAPVIAGPEAIAGLAPPTVRDSPRLGVVLETIRGLRERAGGTIPILGTVISPFSLPVMQMGFGPYLELLTGGVGDFDRLMRVNEEFCVSWANAQIAAGATAISYADPVSSPTIVPRELYLRTGYFVASRTLPRIRGPVVTSLASGACLPILDEIARTGSVGVVASAHEDLAAVKAGCAGRLTVVGNLDALTMRRWSEAEVERQVRRAIGLGGAGGGFVLSDNHGEIPWQVPETTLEAISRAARTWGRYPLRWIERGATDV